MATLWLKYKRLWIALIVASVMLLFFGAVLFYQYYRLEVCNFSSNDGESHGYYLYPDMSVDSLIVLMQADYTIGSERSWRTHRRYLHLKKAEPGYYRFPARLGDKHLIRRLQFGMQTPVHITFNRSIRTNEQLAGQLAKYLMLDSLDILSRLSDSHYMARYGLNDQTSRCLFIPNTYEVYWTIEPDELFERMQREYKHFWNNERRHKADSIGLTPVEVSILASIVQSETRRASDYPNIASLYLNRLHKGMALQACPTVIYATGDLKLRRVLKRHLKIDSPYNTYVNRGLPPGPIRCADQAGIDAVLNAPKTNYLYMCANPDFSGTHIFSSTYGNHASAARQYQRELDNREIR